MVNVYLSLSLSLSLLYSRRYILRVKESGKRTRNAIGEPVLELTMWSFYVKFMTPTTCEI